MAIIEECDSRGLQLLTKDDFVRACAITLQNTPSEDAGKALKDLVYRMRTAFRHRYLMYDAEMAMPPPSLVENVKTVEMFRELFDLMSNGKDEILREQLAKLAHTVLHDSKMDAMSVCKAALGDVVTDQIHFNEFIMVLQPATSRRCLSDMVKLMKDSVQHDTQQTLRFVEPTQAWKANQSASINTTAPYSKGSRFYMDQQATAPSLSQQSMASELARYKQLEEIAQRRADNILGAPAPTLVSSILQDSPQRGPYGLSKSAAPPPTAPSGTPGAGETGGVGVPTPGGGASGNQQTAGFLSANSISFESMDKGEIAQLKLENSKLKSDVLRLQMHVTAVAPSGGGDGRGGSVTGTSHLSFAGNILDDPMSITAEAINNVSGGGTNNTAHLMQEVSRLEQDRERWMHRSELLENELRMCRAHLHTAQEGNELIKALRGTTSVHSTVRDFFPDEAALVAKQDYVRETSRATIEVETGGQPSALTTVMAQYDLLVVAYQALYRELRKRYESSRPKRFDPVKAAANIVPHTFSPTPQQQRSASRPKGGGGEGGGLGGGFTNSRSPVPSKMFASSPLRWSDLDRDPTPDMKNTGMLSDPLLTDNERNFLRQKLAAQMRNSARHYSPKKKPSQRKLPQNETVMTSVDAMQRLHTLADKAGRSPRLDFQSQNQSQSQSLWKSYYPALARDLQSQKHNSAMSPSAIHGSTLTPFQAT